MQALRWCQAHANAKVGDTTTKHKIMLANQKSREKWKRHNIPEITQH